MCATCGCGETSGEVKIYKVGEQKEEHHHHDHSHEHGHSHNREHQKTIDVQKDILDDNRLLAERNRGYFEAKHIKAFNFVSSPGSGKTSLLESTIKALRKDNVYVIEGDQQTDNDARRIESAGAPVIQVNTGNACHLDAHMVHHAIQELNPSNESLLFIENVGNLVCPALFDLGEQHRVVIFSVTEGEDKPLKYPNMFNSSDICIINKVDLLPYLDFNLALAKENALHINHHLQIIEVSVKTGEGMNHWLKLLQA
jgi:hydrogenase nickel incorporation protein HypB